MAFFQIPVRSDIDSYRFRTTLEGAIYLLKFRFNKRMDHWVMDIFDTDENPVIVGRPIMVQIDPFRIFVEEDLPPGNIIPVNLEELNVDPGIDDLGNKVLLFYEEIET